MTAFQTKYQPFLIYGASIGVTVMAISTAGTSFVFQTTLGLPSAAATVPVTVTTAGGTTLIISNRVPYVNASGTTLYLLASTSAF